MRNWGILCQVMRLTRNIEEEKGRTSNILPHLTSSQFVIGRTTTFRGEPKRPKIKKQARAGKENRVVLHTTARKINQLFSTTTTTRPRSERVPPRKTHRKLSKSRPRNPASPRKSHKIPRSPSHALIWAPLSSSVAPPHTWELAPEAYLEETTSSLARARHR